MGAPKLPYPFRNAGPLGLLRLDLVPQPHGPHGPSAVGLWWPYSRDLTREGPHLVDEFPDHHGRIDRIVYAADDWEDVAAELFTAVGRIKAGFFPPGSGRGTVLVRLVGAGTLALRVVWLDPALERAPAALA